MVKEITFKGKPIALIINSSDVPEGTHPITATNWPLQLLMMRRKAGHIFAKHTHTPIIRTVADLQEAIVLSKGILRVTICDRKGEEAGVYDIHAGECIFLIDGGYKIEVAEDAEFFEFKNGPHFENDKILL